MSGQEGNEQLSHSRAEEQADYAVDGGSKGQIELRRKLSNTVSVIRRRPPSASATLLGRNYRAQQVRGAFDPIIGCPQATLGPW
jgi:hypothetical protein